MSHIIERNTTKNWISCQAAGVNSSVASFDALEFVFAHIMWCTAQIILIMAHNYYCWDSVHECKASAHWIWDHRPFVLRTKGAILIQSPRMLQVFTPGLETLPMDLAFSYHWSRSHITHELIRLYINPSSLLPPPLFSGLSTGVQHSCPLWPLDRGPPSHSVSWTR